MREENKFIISDEGWNLYLKKKKNQVFRLLPFREEHRNWSIPLKRVIEELKGLESLLVLDEPHLLEIIAQLNYLKENDITYEDYRTIILEVVNKFDLMKRNTEEELLDAKVCDNTNREQPPIKN